MKAEVNKVRAHDYLLFNDDPKPYQFNRLLRNYNRNFFSVRIQAY